jgi:putative lipoic acid-binding regulatory protein
MNDIRELEMHENKLTDSLIEYPSDFPIKIFGLQQAGFAQAVLEVVTKHDPGFVAATMEMRASRNARYLSLTCTVRATSREQLDALYQELCDHPSIVMVL